MSSYNFNMQNTWGPPRLVLLIATFIERLIKDFHGPGLVIELSAQAPQETSLNTCYSRARPSTMDTISTGCSVRENSRRQRRCLFLLPKVVIRLSLSGCHWRLKY